MRRRRRRRLPCFGVKPRFTLTVSLLVPEPFGGGGVRARTLRLPEEGRGVKRGFSDNPFNSLEGVKCGQ